LVLKFDPVLHVRPACILVSATESKKFFQIPRPDLVLPRHYIDGMQTFPAEIITSETTPVRTDRELLTAFLAEHDELAFDAIVHRHGRLVMTVAWRILRDRHAAEDVFQATFLVLAQQAKSIQKRESLAAWLHGASFRIARKSLQRRQKRRECTMPPDEAVLAAAFTPEDYNNQTALDQEIAALPEPVRGPMVLHYLKDWTAPQIATELGLTLAAVEGRLKRGVRKLRSKLGRRGVGLSTLIAASQALNASAEAATAIPVSFVTSTTTACMAAASGASLPKIVTAEASLLAAKEIIAMTKLALLKTTLIWGSVAAGVTLTGALSTGTFLPRASAQAGAENASPAGSASRPDGVVGDLNGPAVLEPTLNAVSDLLSFQFGAAAPGTTPPAAGSPPTGAPGGAGNGLPASTPPIAGSAGPVGRGPMGRPGMSAMMGGGMGPGGGADGMMAAMGSSAGSQPGTVHDYRTLRPTEEHIEMALQNPADFHFVSQRLEEVLNFLSQSENITIRPDVQLLTDAGVTLDTEMTMVISGVTIDSALHLLLENVNGVKLDYIIEDEVLKITTEEKAAGTVETRVYDVRSLSPIEPEAIARVITRSIEPTTWKRPIAGMGVGISAGGGGGMFQMGMGGMGGQPAAQPGGGGMGGGGLGGGYYDEDAPGSIEPIDGALVITHCQPVHRKVVKLLEQLSRHAQALNSSGTAASTGGIGNTAGGYPGMMGARGMHPGSAYGPGAGIGGQQAMPGTGRYPAAGGFGRPTATAPGAANYGSPAGFEAPQPAAATIPGSAPAADPSLTPPIAPGGGFPAATPPTTAPAR
jgi:RNA polymerase sigma factor (sigma-70 family)